MPDRPAPQGAGRRSLDALSEACAHTYQWHPQSDDYGVCSECGADAPDESKEREMPMVNGYSIYVGASQPLVTGWTVRVYRDADDTHIHSAERVNLPTGLHEAERAIQADVSARTPEPEDA